MSNGAVIHLVDDDGSLRNALQRLLGAAGYQVRTYASAGEFLLQPPGDEPGCLLLDLRMPGPSGLELQESLQRHGITLPVVFLTGHGDLPTGVRAMKAGAVDFLTKPVERDVLLAAIARALQMDAARRAHAAGDEELRSRYAGLTAREREVFRLIVAGKLNKQIGDALGIAERTVKAQRASVMTKLGATNAAELGRIAAELRTVDP
ncbi:MAG TPA: response regulator transcription factor [Burkholderiaceae bacterium]|nr:response regulator transcription factor [Burkholderiaceae bacterium]HQR71059.1 response regulator transcription factor [Burkholderiaceae bacterium]